MVINHGKLWLFRFLVKAGSSLFFMTVISFFIYFVISVQGFSVPLITSYLIYLSYISLITLFCNLLLLILNSFFKIGVLKKLFSGLRVILRLLFTSVILLFISLIYIFIQGI